MSIAHAYKVNEPYCLKKETNVYTTSSSSSLQKEGCRMYAVAAEDDDAVVQYNGRWMQYHW